MENIKNAQSLAKDQARWTSAIFGKSGHIWMALAKFWQISAWPAYVVY